jgi:hypothetical protein
MAVPHPARAQLTATWIGGTGDWTDILSWLPVPLSGSNVNISNGLFTANVALNTNATINDLTIGAGATLRILDGSSLRLQGNSTINGTLTLNSVSAPSDLSISAPSVTFSGSGTIVMSANSGNRIRGILPSNRLINQITIRGSGQIGNEQLSLLNQGTIIADNASARLLIDPNSDGVTNTGTMMATAGATLVLDDETFTNVGGTILADTNSRVDLDDSTIVGGTLVSVGTGRFRALDAELSALTIAGGTNIEVAQNDTLTLVGSIVNDGLISLLGAINSSQLEVKGAVTLLGSGNITMSNSANNEITAAGGGAALTIGQFQMVSGAGDIGRNQVSLTNLGTIAATQPTPLIINNAGGNFTNSGKLKAMGTGGLALADAAVTNFGSVEVMSGSLVTAAGSFTQSGGAGVVSLMGGSFSSGGFSLQAGSLRGTGTVGGPVTATGTGTIEPGGAGAIGTLTFNSALNLGPTTGLFFDLGGTAPGTGYDRINGTNVTLNGSLFLSFVNGYQFTVTSADTLTLINASTALNGTFAGLANGSRLTTADGFGSFQVNYFANTLTLSNFQPIPEPSTYVLLTIGAAGALLAERRRRRSRSSSEV